MGRYSWRRSSRYRGGQALEEEEEDALPGAGVSEEAGDTVMGVIFVDGWRENQREAVVLVKSGSDEDECFSCGVREGWRCDMLVGDGGAV